jgi:hypothetical protein
MSETQEPLRFLDDPAALPRLRAALREGREELPSDAQLASLAARLAPLLGPGGGDGGGGGGEGTDGAVIAAAGSPAATVGKAILAIAAAAAVGGGIAVWSTRGEEPERAPPQREEQRAEVARETEPIPRGLDVPEEIEAPPEPRVRPRAEPRPRFEVDAEAELELISNAQRAVGSQPSRALALAEEHARRFGDGTLAQEREVVAVDALVRLGRTEEARSRADRFRARWPRSASRRRIDVLVPP